MSVKQAPEPVPIALNDLLQESFLFVRHEIETRGIRVTTSYARRVPKIVGDRIQLQQVIVNLLINAAQAVEASCEADREIHIATRAGLKGEALFRSEEHTSELQSLMRISYAVFCLKKQKKISYHISTLTYNTTNRNNTTS